MLVTVCVCVSVLCVVFAGLVNCAVLAASKARFTLTACFFHVWHSGGQVLRILLVCVCWWCAACMSLRHALQLPLSATAS
jgi:hypothetical protein